MNKTITAGIVELNAKRKELETEILLAVERFEKETGICVNEITSIREKVNISSRGEPDAYLFGELSVFIDVAYWLK